MREGAREKERETKRDKQAGREFREVRDKESGVERGGGGHKAIEQNEKENPIRRPMLEVGF